MKTNYKLTEREWDFIDQDGCSWDWPNDWFFIWILWGCWCWHSDHIAELAVEVLAYFAIPAKERDFSKFEDTKLEILGHWMDSKDLIEHWSNIIGSWLTDEWKAVYECIKELW